jgi:hypothetical protein
MSEAWSAGQSPSADGTASVRGQVNGPSEASPQVLEDVRAKAGFIGTEYVSPWTVLRGAV